MTISDLLDGWTERGITLWEDNGQLRYRSPRGVVGPEVIAELRTHKQELLAHLRAIDSGPRARPEDRYEPFPLTDVQGAYLMGRSAVFTYGGVACHLYCELEYPRLDPARVTAAWQTLIARHDMLRVQIDPAGFQRVLPEVPMLTIPVNESSPGSEASSIHRVRERLSHAVHPTGRWPMFAVELTQPSTIDATGPSILHLSYDFLVGDWASLLRLIGEWEDEYAGLPAPPPATVQFRDFVLWERSTRERDAYRTHRNYWLDRLASLPAAPQLPLVPGHDGSGPDGSLGGDGNRPVDTVGTGDTGVRWEGRSLVLPDRLWSRLSGHARKHGVTPTIAVLACYADVLSRWAQSPHFCLNLTVLDRPAGIEELTSVVGDFTSVTLLEVRADEREFITRTHELLQQLFTDLDHRAVSGVDVMRELARTRGRQAAVMPYVFTSAIGLTPQQDGGADRPTGPASIRCAAPPRGSMGFTISQTPQAFLDCQVMDDADGLHVHWDARRGVFPPNVLDDMFSAFTEALQRLATDEQTWHRSSPVELPAEQQRERDRANTTGSALPTGTLHQLVLDSAEADPDAPAVLGRGVRVSYADLSRRAQEIAAVLHRSGIRRGDRVAIAIPRSADQIAAVLGTLVAGAAYVPLDLRQPDARRAAICTDARVAVVLGSGVRFGGDFPTIDIRTVGEDTCAVPDPAAPRDRTATPTDVEPTDLAYVIFTSGSTGRPKGVELSHRAAVNTIMDVNRRCRLGTDDRSLALADLGFDLSVYDIFGPLSVGGAIILPPAADLVAPSTWLDVAAEHQATTLNTVPAVAQLMVSAIRSAGPIPTGIRRWILSGDRIPRELVRDLRQIFPRTQFIAMGGATEAAIWSIAHDITADDSLDRDIPYGRPLANQQFAVLDNLGRDAPTQVPGELVIAGAGLADGYCGAPELTAERFVQHPRYGRIYRTGDRGHYLPGGEIAILGRTDDQVKVQGHRIELGEIESVLAGHPKVSQAAVVVAGEGQQRHLRAFAVPTDDCDPLIDPIRAIDPIRNWTAQAAADASAVVEIGAGDGIRRYAEALDTACAASIAQALDDVSSGAPVAARHRWVLDIWRQALRHRGHERPSPAELPELWDTVAELSPDGLDYRPFTDYVRRCARQLPDLLSGSQPAHELLFPDGSREVAERVYRDRATMQWGNAAITGFLSQMTRARIAGDRHASEPIRVLEIGAGTASSTVNVVAGLSAADFRYTFTDRSDFFLPAARERWGADQRWTFKTLDIDRDPVRQGYRPESYDVVCAFGVLENVRDITRSLDWLAGLTAPHGLILISEPVSDQWWVYVSQIFLMTRPDNGSRQNFGLFPPASWWQAQLRAIAGGQVSTLPDPDSPLAAENFAFFAARRHGPDRPAPYRDIPAYLAEHLPPVMVPQRTEFLPELPLTRNGKIDRSALAALAATAEDGPSRAGGSTSAPPAGTDQPDPVRTAQLPTGVDRRARQLAELWAGQLSLDRVPDSHQNPFDLGANSVIAATVAGQLRDNITELGEVSFETVLRTLLTAPTIGAAAAELSPSATPTTERPTQQPNVLITPLSTGAPAKPVGSRLTLLLGDSLADTIPATRLATALPEAFGTRLALTVPDDDWFLDLAPEQATATIADLASRDLMELDADEYCLIGYSYGALVAIETSRRLLEAGRRVLPLGLVDPHVTPPAVDDLLTEVMFMTTQGVSPERLLPDHCDVPDLAAILDRLATRPRPAHRASGSEHRVDTFFATLAALDDPERWTRYAAAAAEGRPDGATPDAAGLRTRWLRHRQIMRAASVPPDPIVSDAILIQPRDSYGFLPDAHDRAITTWKETLIGTVAVGQVAGDHFTLLDGRSAPATGAALVRGLTELGGAS